MKNTFNCRRSMLRVGVASAAIGLTMLNSVAVAQETDEQAEAVNSIADEKPEVGEETGIVVTGSRIRQNEATSASPLQIIDPVLAQRQGQIDTAEMIQSSPIAAGSSQITSAISSNAITNGGPGASTISLRGLGAERTLVLLNGRRAGPAGTRGGVAAFDLNVLPQSIVKQVDVLKDGASSIYGSDAVAGVVNVITKTDTDGLELTGFTSIPTRSGGETYQASATWGKDFGSGHILLSGDYYKKKELKRRDRSYLDCPEDYRIRDDGSRADLIDPRTGSFRCNGVIWGHVWTYYAYNLPDSNLTLLQYSYGNDNLGATIPGVTPPTGPGEISAPAGWFPVGYDRPSIAVQNEYHPFEAKSSVSPETERMTLYAEGAIDIVDDVELYGEFIYNKRKTYTDTLTQIYNFGYASDYDPTQPGDPFAGFEAPFGGGIILSPTGIVDQFDNSQNVQYYRGVAGVRGGIAGSWTFDAYGQYSKSIGKYTYQQILKDAVNSQNFKTESCVGTFTPISNRPCIDINWADQDFLNGDLSPEEQAFLLDTETGKTDYEQIYGEASVTGNLFDLPGGTVGIALGVAYRRDEINDQPGHVTQAPDPDNPGEFVDNGFANPISSGRTYGFSVTKEAFAEVNLPLLSDVPFAKSLTFAGAARVTNVSAERGSDGLKDSTNGNWTYKLTGNWQINDWVRLRGTYGTSFRAPALFELFLADQVSTVRGSGVDPCFQWGTRRAQDLISQRIADNCAADGIPATHTTAGIQPSVFQGGGLGVVEPETSTAKTASIILTPRFAFLPDTRLSLTVDYFDIQVKGEIDQLGAANIVYGCYDSDIFPDDPLCDLFERGQDGNPNNIRNIFDSFINVNEQRNRGVDVTFRANQDLGNFGDLSFLAQMTWQTKDTITLFNGNIENLNGEIGDPRWTGDFKLNWDLGSTSLFYGVTVVGKSSNEADYVEDNGDTCFNSAIYGQYCAIVATPTVFYHNASVTQEVGDNFEISFGMTNIFDTKPPRLTTTAVSSIGQSPFVSQYDWLGRRLFLQAKAKF